MLLSMLIRKLTFCKIKNIILLKVGYWLSIILKKPYIWGSPMSISIEPINQCNLECVECALGNGQLTRPKELLDLESYIKIVNQLSPNLVYMSLFFQGEPFLHPHFTEMVHIAHKKNIFTSTSTNAHFFNDEEFVKKVILSGLDRLIVSIDGTTQESYEKYRKGGNLEKVLSGLQKLVEQKKKLKSTTPFIEVQFLVMSHNEHQIPDIKKICKDLKINKLKLKTTQIINFENGSVLMPKNTRYCRYKKCSDGKFHIKGTLKNRCWRQWSAAVITSAGDLVPCCFDKNATHKFGNLYEQPFKEIWKNKQANSFRETILTNRQGIKMCNNCTEI